MLRGKHLTSKVFDIICKEWPCHPSDVCRVLNIECNSSNISKIRYHFDRLRKENKIITKKIDRALIAWPYQIEKLRVMQELIG